jgi:hypothetical protein
MKRGSEELETQKYAALQGGAGVHHRYAIVRHSDNKKLQQSCEHHSEVRLAMIDR